jgi:hypothetical protein
MRLMVTNGAKSGLNVTIRSTRPEHFDEILPLLKQLWPANPINLTAARDIFTKGLASGRRAYLCACLGEKIIVFGTLEVDYRTIDPGTGAIVAYLFDSWRCVAAGTGQGDGNKEIIEWKWSADGQGTSVRTTPRISQDRFIVTEKYTLPGGGTMEDRVQMVRAK